MWNRRDIVIQKLVWLADEPTCPMILVAFVKVSTIFLAFFKFCSFNPYSWRIKIINVPACDIVVTQNLHDPWKQFTCPDNLEDTNKAGYTAHDAPSMRSFHLRKITRDRRTDGRTDGRTDTTSYRDATAHLKRFLSFFLRQTFIWRKIP